MKLVYRGVHYERPPAELDVTEGEIGGKYHGQYWRYQYPRHVPQLRSKTHLNYRGIRYSTAPTVETRSPRERALAAATQRQQPAAAVEATSQAYWEALRRNWERRWQVAQASGDDRLVRMLERESEQLALDR